MRCWGRGPSLLGCTTAWLHFIRGEEQCLGTALLSFGTTDRRRFFFFLNAFLDNFPTALAMSLCPFSFCLILRV